MKLEEFAKMYMLVAKAFGSENMKGISFKLDGFTWFENKDKKDKCRKSKK